MEDKGKMNTNEKDGRTNEELGTVTLVPPAVRDELATATLILATKKFVPVTATDELVAANLAPMTVKGELVTVNLVPATVDVLPPTFSNGLTTAYVAYAGA